MHIPDGILSVPVLAGTWAISATALSWAARRSKKELDQSLVPLAGVAGAFIFAAQMIQIPIPVVAGTSGHLLGGTLLALLLGPAPAILVMAAVLTVQCLLFQDGGLLALGANLLNMAVTGPLVGYGTYRLLRPLTGRFHLVIAAGLAAWTSMVAGALLAGLELGLSSPIRVTVAMWALGGVHAAIGLIEATVTAVICSLSARPQGTVPLWQSQWNRTTEDMNGAEQSTAPTEKGTTHDLSRAPSQPRSMVTVWMAIGGGSALFLAMVLAQFASELPDGLEHVLGSFGIRPGAPTLSAPMPGYTLPWLAGWTGKALGALLGLAGAALLAFSLSRFVGSHPQNRPPKPKPSDPGPSEENEA